MGGDGERGDATSRLLAAIEREAEAAPTTLKGPALVQHVATRLRDPAVLDPADGGQFTIREVLSALVLSPALNARLGTGPATQLTQKPPRASTSSGASPAAPAPEPLPAWRLGIAVWLAIVVLTVFGLGLALILAR